ncbi:MAG TPA: substrate-binding domain-containing protein [Feifaniaceae bacterium]|nr:substrate-binding domain-containing protein [Feifaniaceae bacterium]
MSKTLYALAEPSYITSVWFSKSIKGMNDAALKQHGTVTLLQNEEALSGAKDMGTLILIGANSDWTEYMVRRMRARGVKVVLMGAVPTDFGEDVSGALLSRQTLVESMVRYFYGAGRRRLACVGNETRFANDNVRKHAFLEAAKNCGLDVDERRDVYSLDAGLDDCISRFLEHADRYDGAICPSDYVAVHLLVRAREQKIRVPEQLFVAGSGNFVIGCCATPSLTTSTLDYYKMGVQTVNIWNLLEKNPGIIAANVSIPCEIICRGSTAYLPVSEQKPADPPEYVKHPPIEEADPRLFWLRKLEDCLLRCDALDYAILNGVLRGNSTEDIAGKLFASAGTVQYRLKKLYGAMGADSRREFVQALGPYVTNLEYLRNTEILNKGGSGL